MADATTNLAEKAVEFLEAAQAVAGGASPESALDGVDTSVAGLGALDPVIDDEILAEIKERVKKEGLAPAILKDLLAIAGNVAGILRGI